MERSNYVSIDYISKSTALRLCVIMTGLAPPYQQMNPGLPGQAGHIERERGPSLQNLAGS